MSDTYNSIRCPGCGGLCSTLWDPPFCAPTCRTKNGVVLVHSAALADALDPLFANTPIRETPAPAKAPTKTLVSMNGRDWVNYALLDEAAEPLNRYPHWQIWRGDELLMFHPSPPVVPTCELETPEGFVCGKPGLLRRYRTIFRVACDACYHEHQRMVGNYTARVPEHIRAGGRMARMDLHDAGFGAPEPRACTPILAGGIFNLSSGR